MQVGKVNWVGQTFALARCSDSQGKKPRNRRTKEERRKMVESFIKRYRDSNNGNFPSLNLTHKEVGGSFYTVREIVREIIQENKVLRPGSLSSQAFNLDDYSEQHSPEAFSSDYPHSLSLTTIEHSNDERMREPSGCIVNIDKGLSTFSFHDTTILKEEFMLHSHDISVPPVNDGVCDEEQHSKNWHNNVDATNDKSSNELVELAGHGQNYSPTQDDDKPYVEDKDNRAEGFAKCETDNPIEDFQSPLINSTTSKDIENAMQVNDANRLIYLFAERQDAFDAGYACDALENLSSSGHGGGSSPRHAGELHSFHSTEFNDSVSEQTSVEREEILDASGPTEASVIATKNVAHMQVYSDPSLESMGSLSSTIVDQETAVCVKTPLTDLADCPTDKNLQVEQPLNSSHAKVTSVNESTSGEPGLKNSIGRSSAGEKVVDGTNREPSGTSERMENTEANPLLAIIKGLVTAFIKFWTE